MPKCPSCLGNKCDDCNETGYAHVSYTFGTTPVEVFYERLPESYPIEAHSYTRDYLLLECIFPDHNVGVGDYGRTRWTFDRDQMVHLLERLLEVGDEDADSLRSGICTTLNIEEI